LADCAEGVLLTVRVVPRSSRTKLVLEGDGLKLRLAAPPVEGAANAELVKFLAKLFGLPRSGVEMASGHKSRVKKILLRGLKATEARSILAETL